MKRNKYLFYSLPAIAGLIFGLKSFSGPDKIMSNESDSIHVVHLDQNAPENFNKMQLLFEQRNPGYHLDFHFQTKEIQESKSDRLLFIQRGGGSAALSSGESSKVSVGDIVHLEKNKKISCDSLLDILSFTIPTAVPNDIPKFIRPDWDLNITDVPGGCATETNAYRRILLTWMGKNGKYLYHGLNAHRVRIMDSFTHYHPVDIGFDEFYLVQMAMPNARLITSSKVDKILSPETLNRSEVNGLLTETPLHPGDLIYIPKGVAHRGVGGVLAQVITVPGFVPGSEIGIDHHLAAINSKFNLTGSSALPLNQEASGEVVVK